MRLMVLVLLSLAALCVAERAWCNVAKQDCGPGQYCNNWDNATDGQYYKNAGQCYQCDGESINCDEVRLGLSNPSNQWPCCHSCDQQYCVHRCLPALACKTYNLMVYNNRSCSQHFEIAPVDCETRCEACGAAPPIEGCEQPYCFEACLDFAHCLHDPDEGCNKAPQDCAQRCHACPPLGAGSEWQTEEQPKQQPDKQEFSEVIRANVYQRQAECATVPETQVVTAVASSAMGGTFALSVRGQRTTDVAHNASAAAVRAALEALPTMGSVQVERSSAGPGYSWTVTFSTDVGDVPTMNALTAGLTGTDVSVTIMEVVKGTAPLGAGCRLQVGAFFGNQYTHEKLDGQWYDHPHALDKAVFRARVWDANMTAPAQGAEIVRHHSGAVCRVENGQRTEWSLHWHGDRIYADVEVSWIANYRRAADETLSPRPCEEERSKFEMTHEGLLCLLPNEWAGYQPQSVGNQLCLGCREPHSSPRMERCELTLVSRCDFERRLLFTDGRVHNEPVWGVQLNVGLQTQGCEGFVPTPPPAPTPLIAETVTCRSEEHDRVSRHRKMYFDDLSPDKIQGAMASIRTGEKVCFCVDDTKKSAKEMEEGGDKGEAEDEKQWDGIVRDTPAAKAYRVLAGDRVPDKGAHSPVTFCPASACLEYVSARSTASRAVSGFLYDPVSDRWSAHNLAAADVFPAKGLWCPTTATFTDPESVRGRPDACYVLEPGTEVKEDGWFAHEIDCGCDGQDAHVRCVVDPEQFAAKSMTFVNACTARCWGVSPSECNNIPVPDPNAGCCAATFRYMVPRGGLAKTCVGDGDKIADVLPTCPHFRDCLCQRDYKPVRCEHAGADGEHVYPNQCMASCQGAGDCRDPHTQTTTWAPECMCHEQYDPVRCDDGKVYPNICKANCAKPGQLKCSPYIDDCACLAAPGDAAVSCDDDRTFHNMCAAKCAGAKGCHFTPILEFHGLSKGYIYNSTGPSCERWERGNHTEDTIAWKLYNDGSMCTTQLSYTSSDAAYPTITYYKRWSDDCQLWNKGALCYDAHCKLCDVGDAVSKFQAANGTADTTGMRWEYTGASSDYSLRTCTTVEGSGDDSFRVTHGSEMQHDIRYIYGNATAVTAMAKRMACGKPVSPWWENMQQDPHTRKSPDWRGLVRFTAHVGACDGPEPPPYDWPWVPQILENTRIDEHTACQQVKYGPDILTHRTIRCVGPNEVKVQADCNSDCSYCLGARASYAHARYLRPTSNDTRCYANYGQYMTLNETVRFSTSDDKPPEQWIYYAGRVVSNETGDFEWLPCMATQP